MARRKRRGEAAFTPPDRPWSVLVVHSEPELSEIIVRVLSGADHQVARAASEHEVISALGSHAFHCCVLDMHGGTSGDRLRMTNAIRGSESAQVSTVPLVALSDSYSSELFSWQNGVDEFLVRPFHANDLLAAVESAVGRAPGARAEHRAAGVERAYERKTRPVPEVQAWQTFRV